MKSEQQESVYDLSLVEARDKVLKAARDASAMADAIPGELGKWARLWRWVAGWWRAPRSRIGLALVLSACLLGSGCATSGPRVVGAVGGAFAGVVIAHNYLVAEQEAYEREEVEAGRTPLRPSNGQIIAQNWYIYLGSGAAGGATGYVIADWAIDSAEDGDTVNNSTTINNPPPDPIAEDPQGQAGEE